MTAQTDPRPVIVGIDGTPSGLEALSLGSALAVLAGAPLVLGAIYGFESMTSTFGGPAWPLREEASKWLEEAEQRLGDAIGSRSVSVSAATIAQGLIELAEGEDAGLIVLGSSRRGPVGRLLAGSGARRVVHGAPCAVAVAPHGWHLQRQDKPLTFGAAFTDAPESHEALALAARLAAPGHARLRVLTVVELISPTHPLFAATGTSYAGWVRERREQADTLAREAVTSIGGADVKVLDGDPVECLVTASSDLDLLVVGSRRYGPVRRALLGSVSAPLIELAECAVLVVPRGVHADALEAGAAGAAAHV